MLALLLAVAFSAPIDAGNPVVITSCQDWIPIKDTTDIIPGSALDFSNMVWRDAPAGQHGRIVAKGSHFEFEKVPGVAQRFYGVNLCVAANFPSRKAAAEELASRLARIGYNSVRLHMFEEILTEGSPDGTTINESRMAQLDDLAAACIDKGLYLTTDLYVSRRPAWRALGIDRDGRCVKWAEFKDLCLYHEGAYSNLCAFARQLLGHVNPRTGRSWAEEPALAWVSLINEGNPGNNFGLDRYKSSPEAVAKWKAWLLEKKRSEPAAYGDLSEDDLPSGVNEDSKRCRAFMAFLADLQRDFDRRFIAFLRGELKCRALISNMSSWHDTVEYQRVRTAYDYVDMHFYVDHPQFPGGKWGLPSKCPNVNPVKGKTGGFVSVARCRLLDRPFTISEFNYTAPGRWRGVGGLLLGAQAALQDYDAIWRYNWSHSDSLSPSPLSYFHTADDPLTRASERAALCLFLRRDVEPLSRVSTMLVPDGKDDDAISRGGQNAFGKLMYGWYSRLGTVVGDRPVAGSSEVFSHQSLASVKDEELIERLEGAKPGDGQVVVDRERGVFGVASPRTCGLLCEEGRGVAGALAAEMSIAPSVVWASSLDGRPLESSARILLSHVADVQDEGISYADHERKTLLKWGRLPHLMQRAHAEIALRRSGSTAGVRVFALGSDGARRCEIPVVRKPGGIRFSADTSRDPDDATFLYEIVE